MRTWSVPQLSFLCIVALVLNLMSEFVSFDQEPLDILEMLNCERGRQIITCVQSGKALSHSDQIYLMDRIHASVTKDRESPFKK